MELKGTIKMVECTVHGSRKNLLGLESTMKDTGSVKDPNPRHCYHSCTSRKMQTSVT